MLRFFKNLKKAWLKTYESDPKQTLLFSAAVLAILLLLLGGIIGLGIFLFSPKPSPVSKPPVTSSPKPTDPSAPPSVSLVPSPDSTVSPTPDADTPTPTPVTLPTVTPFAGRPGECDSVTTDRKVTPTELESWPVHFLMLVNWDHFLKYTGDPEGLVNMTDIMTDSRYVFDDASKAKGNYEAVVMLNQMCLDAMNAGCSRVKFSATGTYRTYEVQDNFWQKHIKEDANYGADPYRNPPRTVPAVSSEHRTGLGFDIWMTEYDYNWLHKNCYKYGFILRFPSDKIGYTGIMYEQWHFRYVGVEAATQMYELGYCLEEYIAYLNGVSITPHPTATKAPTKAPTKTPTPTPTLPATLPTQTPEITPGAEPTPEPSIDPTPEVSVTPELSLTPTPVPEITPEPTGSPEPTQTPVPTPAPTPTPEPTPTIITLPEVPLGS